MPGPVPAPEQRNFLFENRSLVDFQIGNERYIAHDAHFLYDNRSLVVFLIGNEHQERYVAHCRIENRLMIDFQIGNCSAQDLDIGSGVGHGNRIWGLVGLTQILFRSGPDPGQSYFLFESL